MILIYYSLRRTRGFRRVRWVFTREIHSVHKKPSVTRL